MDIAQSAIRFVVFTVLSRRLRGCSDQRYQRFCKRRASAAPGRTPTDQHATNEARRCAQSHDDQAKPRIERVMPWRGCGVNLASAKINITGCCIA
jgi:hypothetical protein